MRRLTTTALALAAGASLAAAAAPDKDVARAHRGEAKRHIWTSDVSLEQARLGLQGLYALTDDNDGAFDQAHATFLVRNVEREVDTAASHLAKLTLVPAEKDDARTNLSKVQMDLAQLQADLKGLAKPVVGGELKGLRGEVKVTWKELDTALSDFHRVADDYKVSTRLPTP